MANQVINSLEHPVDALKPNELEAEISPTPLEHANNIAQWVKHDFKRVIEDPAVRFEHKHYGSKNTFFNSVFPIHRRFSVVPQGLLRQVKTHLPNLATSTGSTGAQQYGRENKGQRENEQRLYPDFTIVKVIPTDESTPRRHYLLCIIEIKHPRVGLQDRRGMESQMLRYMTASMKHRYRDQHLKGFLLYGRFYQQFELDHDASGDFVNYVSDEFHDMYAPGDPLTLALCKLAVQEWNRKDVDDIPLTSKTTEEDSEVYVDEAEDAEADKGNTNWIPFDDEMDVDKSMDVDNWSTNAGQSMYT
ncbi:hypothetical protein K435DRAFT_873237 [Dendrothele bispora CBS 962.96]|uniref:Uncharacterized protein n=1 Tax=Dendrothele bispora (strain CBS 962.96) TaxID=1314807 RepID=A0A4S8L019_DENBC|nr:hypothetical protein K435DRAFT_873237 [Dendrothele bispora CBS 962.96]